MSYSRELLYVVTVFYGVLLRALSVVYVFNSELWSWVMVCCYRVLLCFVAGGVVSVCGVLTSDLISRDDI